MISKLRITLMLAVVACFVWASWLMTAVYREGSRQTHAETTSPVSSEELDTVAITNACLNQCELLDIYFSSVTSETSADTIMYEGYKYQKVDNDKFKSKRDIYNLIVATMSNDILIKEWTDFPSDGLPMFIDIDGVLYRNTEYSESFSTGIAADNIMSKLEITKPDNFSVIVTLTLSDKPVEITLERTDDGYRVASSVMKDLGLERI